MAQNSPAFGLCRPPGHHASRAHGGGYCLFNNIAVAAARAVEQDKRVSILDLDFHHGNGTQDLFYDTSQVQYLSLHADPSISYPFFWGSKDEQGEGEGLGYTHNYPLDPLVTGEKYQAVLDTALVELERNDPDIILVSMGFDTYIEDPIAGMQLRRDDYYQIGSRLSEYSSIGFILEGGYHLDTLGSNFMQLIEGMGI
jgi:acetoin utilization deacetylase AcuC-like enzyme